VPWLHAETVTVSWDPNSETDLAGYKIYYSVNSRDYNNSVDVGNVTSFTISGLTTGITYYFAVTAYDFAGNESGFSQEVSAMIGGDTNPPDLVDIFVNGDTQIDVVFSEPMDEASAETAANYTINNGIRVIGAVLDDATGTTVRLITSAHQRGQTYLLTVNNVTDVAGNPVPAGTSRSYDLPQSSDDTLPPELVLVEVVDANRINVIFNEPVEEISAQDVNNYAIDSGVQVIQADLQSSLSVVQLTTTQHQNGTSYTLTVTGVTDRAAVPNVIGDKNSYTYQFGAGGDTDSAPPQLVSVVVNGATQIDVNFNEPLEQVSAEDKNNYVIVPGIVVIGAVLGSNLTTVHLITSKHEDGREYTLVVNNIADRATTPNVMQANATQLYVFNSDGDFPNTPGDSKGGIQPRAFTLFQNYPNPFNPETEIRFFLETERDVRLNVYNSLGQLVKTIVSNVLPAGYHTALWDGSNRDGRLVPSGVYFYSLEITRDVLRDDQLVNVSLERRVKRMSLVR